ncbi:MAG: endonuclease domain-containing protein [Parvibaculum sp.]|nr:endonuclease domain-containing protein [Parvibaculum sp.]
MANERARHLRRNQTEAERRLWLYLKDMKREGFHFRRQCPVGPYVADFLCYSARIIVEVDGGQHGLDPGIEHDRRRDEWFVENGYRVLRYWNNDVLGNTQGVMETILSILNEGKRS